MDQANWYNRISERGPKMKKSILEISCHYSIIMIFFIFLFYSCCHSPFHSPCPESNWGSDYLCSECKDMSFDTSCGTCEVCGRGTSSGAFRLCNSCACKLKECQHCRKILEIYFWFCWNIRGVAKCKNLRDWVPESENLSLSSEVKNESQGFSFRNIIFISISFMFTTWRKRKAI